MSSLTQEELKKLPRSGAYKNPKNWHLREDLKQLASEGLSSKEIAEELGVTPGSVTTLCAKYGIKIHRKSKKCM